MQKVLELKRASLGSGGAVTTEFGRLAAPGTPYSETKPIEQILNSTRNGVIGLKRSEGLADKRSQRCLKFCDKGSVRAIKARVDVRKESKRVLN